MNELMISELCVKHILELKERNKEIKKERKKERKKAFLHLHVCI